jgi:hypothetical protein
MIGPTLEDILGLPEDNEVRRALVNAGIATPYDAFCERVEDAILGFIIKVEEKKPNFAKSDEDALTGILAMILDAKGFSADHDNYRNGHCDLLVKQGRYEWYGEAKLDKGPAYALEGFRQLCDRYSPGGPNTCRGGLIVYTVRPNKLEILKDWVARIDDEFESDMNFTPICEQTLTTVSRHVHPATGLEFRVRHFPISFYHKPTDKSARARKK